MLLTRPALMKEINEGRLVFDPPLIDGQVGPSSIDLRLGNKFVTFDAAVARQRAITGLSNAVDVAGYELDGLVESYGAMVDVADSAEMRLDPWSLVLGWTKEYIRLPDTLAARVEGKSKPARLGLMVHVTAPTVQVGWEGNLQLEFLNVGPFHLVIRPGLSICQLLVESVVEPAAYKGQFQGQRQP